MGRRKPLPPQAGATGFDHVLLNWNHLGHAPKGVFDVAHVDVHFYLTDEAARAAIEPTDPAYLEEAAREPARRFRTPRRSLSRSRDGRALVGQDG